MKELISTIIIIFHLTLGNKSKGHFMNKSLLLVHNKNAAEVLTWLPGPQWTCRWIWRYSFRISKLDLETIMMMLIMAHWHIVHIFTKYPFRMHHSTSLLTWRPCRPGPRWTCAACPRCWGRWCSHSGRRPCSAGSRVSSPGHQKDISTYLPCIGLREGLLPALHVTVSDLVECLQQGPGVQRGGGAGRHHHRPGRSRHGGARGSITELGSV